MKFEIQLQHMVFAILLVVGTGLGVLFGYAALEPVVETVVEIETPDNYEYLLDCHNGMADYMDAPDDSPAEEDALGKTRGCFNEQEPDESRSKSK